MRSAQQEQNKQQHFALNSAQQALAERIARYTEGLNRLETAVPQLVLNRFPEPTEPASYMLPAAICLIGQGRKRVLLGDETYVYDAHNFLITSVDLPVVTQVLEANAEQPYLGLTLDLDPKDIRHLMVESNLAASRTVQAERGIAVSPASADVLNAFVRLLDLLATPQDIPILAPLIKREILYRLLIGEQGPRLRRIAEVGSQSEQIARAIDWIKANFTEPFHIDDLASKVGMSPSTFHHHFRKMTALSPLKFVKRLRLNEARRLMLTEHQDAASAAMEVGYESASQFSREYSRQFGAPPLRDIKNLQETVKAQP
jgi:AraC-like DNA-binding protein